MQGRTNSESENDNCVRERILRRDWAKDGELYGQKKWNEEEGESRGKREEFSERELFFDQVLEKRRQIYSGEKKYEEKLDARLENPPRRF